MLQIDFQRSATLTFVMQGHPCTPVESRSTIPTGQQLSRLLRLSTESVHILSIHSHCAHYSSSIFFMVIVLLKVLLHIASF